MRTVARHPIFALAVTGTVLAALAVIVALALGASGPDLMRLPGEHGVLAAVNPVPAAPATAGAVRVTTWYVQQVIQGTGIPTNPNLLLPAGDNTVTSTRLEGNR